MEVKEFEGKNLSELIESTLEKMDEKFNGVRRCITFLPRMKMNWKTSYVKI